MTINKTKYQSLKGVGTDLKEECFPCGQLYVACWRSGSAKGLCTLAPQEKEQAQLIKKFCSKLLEKECTAWFSLEDGDGLLHCSLMHYQEQLMLVLSHVKHHD